MIRKNYLSLLNHSATYEMQVNSLYMNLSLFACTCVFLCWLCMATFLVDLYQIWCVASVHPWIVIGIQLNFLLAQLMSLINLLLLGVLSNAGFFNIYDAYSIQMVFFNSIRPRLAAVVHYGPMARF